MNVAILCPGPSLARHDPRQWRHARRVIAVNRAAEDFDCDWWAMLDAETFGMFKPRSEACRVFTFDVSVDRLTTGDHAHLSERFKAHRAVRVGELEATANFGPPQSWATYTGPAALVLAVWIGARSIDVFGCDLAGNTDHKGQRGLRRGPDRWAEETKHWQEITAWAEARNVRIRRQSGT